MATHSGPLLEFVEISKSFPGVRALDKISFAVQRGHVHALVGENGAGKSTLINLLSGALQPDSGRIVFNGRDVTIPSPHTAQELGISTVYQEFNLCGNLSVAGNIFVGREVLGSNHFLDWRAMNAQASDLLAMVGMPLEPQTPVKDLKVSQQQLTEIAKALGRDASLIIMDEPTSALTDHEVRGLFQTIRQLKKRGVTILYVSHRLEEVFEIADDITVLRDGQCVGTHPIADVTIPKTIYMMVGRELEGTELGESRVPETQTPLLCVNGLSIKGKFQDVGFQISAGEILGFFGLQGSGKSEIGRAIFGLQPVDGGSVIVDGQPVKISSPADAVKYGLCFAPSDRRGEGLVLQMDVESNIALVNIEQVSKFGFINRKKLRQEAEQFKQSFDIACPSLEQLVGNLSGGNQQKVVLARLLAARPRLLIMDEPTRGIDVGAKAEIHRLLRELADNGLAVIIMSSELPEVHANCDRVIVMRQGRVTGEFRRGTATASEIMAASL